LKKCMGPCHGYNYGAAAAVLEEKVYGGSIPTLPARPTGQCSLICQLSDSQCRYLGYSFGPIKQMVTCDAKHQAGCFALSAVGDVFGSEEKRLYGCMPNGATCKTVGAPFPNANVTHCKSFTFDQFKALPHRQKLPAVRKVIIKIEAMTEDSFEREKDNLREKFAKLLNISVDRIQIVAERELQERRLLMQPLNTLEDVQGTTTITNLRMNVLDEIAGAPANEDTEVDADTAVKQLEDGSVSESQVVETVKAAGIKVTGVSVPATAAPTQVPTSTPTTADPTLTPTIMPTQTPSVAPTVVPTAEPTVGPTVVADLNTLTPSFEPTTDPSTSPTVDPTADPSTSPTIRPTADPTSVRTTSWAQGSSGRRTTSRPTIAPTQTPSVAPTVVPTAEPTVGPTVVADLNTLTRSFEPTTDPSTSPTVDPTADPSTSPTFKPTGDHTRDNILDGVKNIVNKVVNKIKKMVKLKLKVQKMTKQEFEAKAADLKGNIAELLGISADRIKIALMPVAELASTRRLLVFPIEHLEIDTEPQSVIVVTVNDATASAETSEPDAETAAAKIKGKSATELTKDLGIQVVAPATVEPAVDLNAESPAPSSSSNSAGIIGGLAAGFVGGAILVVAILFFTSRGQKENDANFKKAVDDSSLFPAKTADAGYRPIV